MEVSKLYEGGCPLRGYSETQYDQCHFRANPDGKGSKDLPTAATEGYENIVRTDIPAVGYELDRTGSRIQERLQHIDEPWQNTAAAICAACKELASQCLPPETAITDRVQTLELYEHGCPATHQACSFVVNFTNNAFDRADVPLAVTTKFEEYDPSNGGDSILRYTTENMAEQLRRSIPVQPGPHLNTICLRCRELASYCLGIWGQSVFVKKPE